MKKEKWQLTVQGNASTVKHSGSGFLKWTSATGTGATSLPFNDDVTVDGSRKFMDLYFHQPKGAKLAEVSSTVQRKTPSLDFNPDGELFCRYRSIFRLSKCPCLVWLTFKKKKDNPSIFLWNVSQLCCLSHQIYPACFILHSLMCRAS